MSKDETWWLLKAQDKRRLVVSARRVAGMVSLNRDREALLAEAAQLEAEADRMERQNGGGAGSQREREP